MSRESRRDVKSSPFAWTTIFYLLLVFIAPLALIGTAQADEQAPAHEHEEYGTGKLCGTVNVMVILKRILTCLL